jgi:hypothetical protein
MSYLTKGAVFADAKAGRFWQLSSMPLSGACDAIKLEFI